MMYNWTVQTLVQHENAEEKYSNEKICSNFEHFKRQRALSARQLRIIVQPLMLLEDLADISSGLWFMASWGSREDV
jgi:hypothetical protein